MTQDGKEKNITGDKNSVKKMNKSMITNNLIEEMEDDNDNDSYN